MNDLKRIHVTLSGLVQGVAFRHETRKMALSLSLTGWVRNLADGRVEAVFEGNEKATAAMLAWCRQGPPLARVLNVDVEKEIYKGEFSDFRIRY